ncbi:MAG: hypothetical protein LBU61_04865 [Coriobacteriales bacterium]|jgi:hypothetical protein|nr:hypothetical protein [Coriobacteriales bacterium]
MAVSAKLEYRKKLLDDAVRFKKMERVPHISNFALWPVVAYGAKLSEACRDWDLMEQVYRWFMDEFQFDCSGMIGGFFCNPPKMLDRIGEGYNVFDDEAGTVSLEDFELLQPDEYDELVNDLPGLVWNKLLPRKFANWGNVTVGDLFAAAEEFARFGGFMEHMAQVCVDEYELPSQAGHMINMPGIEILYNNLRGIKGTSLDIRRIPDKVQMVVDHYNMKPEAVYNIFMDSPTTDTYAFGTSIGSLAHNFLSIDQWDRYIWPYISGIIDAAVKADTTVHIFTQGVISRFYDYFKDIPKGHVAIHVEQTDVFDFRENLPNICVIGGMTTKLLGSGSAKQCVDYAKFLCDELGRDGGFILSQEKMMSYLRDAKPENVKAVCDFAQEYRL